MVESLKIKIFFKSLHVGSSLEVQSGHFDTLVVQLDFSWRRKDRRDSRIKF